MAKKSLGVNMTPPETSCDDKKCPWHGNLPVRGRFFDGTVKSAKATNSVVVSWDYNLFVPKYERHERRKGRISAHSPKCIHAKEGDRVRVAECRPLSKTKSFVVVGIVK